jgi:hypothetical protein
LTNTTVTNVDPIQFSNGVFTNIPYTTTTSGTKHRFMDAKVDGIRRKLLLMSQKFQVQESEIISSIVASKANGDTVGLSIEQL